MLVLPLRAKNPPERYPWVTIGLISVNTLVYALTTDYFISIQRDVVENFGLSYHTFSPLRLLTSMFLHGNLLHLIGNMLFLWIFGAAVEGRLGHLRFLVFYLFVGVVGSICHELVDGILHPRLFAYGASGAIMGVAGAYIYLFPFARILVAYCYSLLVSFRAGIAAWQAQWVILFFFATDIFEGLLYHGLDGTAHFAHIGGFGAGFLLLLAMRLRRDSENVSEAQAMRSDAGDNLLALSLPELESLMEGHPENTRIALAFLYKAATHYDVSQRKLGGEALRRHGAALIEAGDANQIAVAVLANNEILSEVPSQFLFRLGSKLEAADSRDQAGRCYRAVCMRGVDVPEEEMALARLARLTETEGNPALAAAIWIELQRRFPNGPQAANAEIAVRRLGKPELVFSTGYAATKAAAIVKTEPAQIPDGLARVAPTAYAERVVARDPEPVYSIGDVRGMSLTPIGGRQVTERQGDAITEDPTQNG